MPTIMTHAAVPLALAVAAGRGKIGPKLAFAGIVLAMFPDADVVSFSLGVPYEAAWGHRGASHSITLAFVISVVVTVLLQPGRPVVAFLFLWMSAASHGLLDMLTDGGLGVAALWPWEDSRFFAPIRPVQVSPIGIGSFLSMEGWSVIKSELRSIWLPLSIMTAMIWGMRRAYSWQSRPLPVF